MKIGILTFQKTENYGALLQTYAMQKAVGMAGHEGAEIINFKPGWNADGARAVKWRLMGPREIARRIILGFYAKEKRTRRERIEQFRARYFNLTKPLYTAAALEKDAQTYDVYITGSDQVWNVENGISPVWLLDFVKTGRKIAYAPSFGSDFVDPRYYKVFEKYLPLFDALSCLEWQGVKIIQQMTGLSSEHVLDPTLLLPEEEWSKLSVAPAIKGAYLLVYSLAGSPEFVEIVSRVAKQTGLPIVVLCVYARTPVRGAMKVVRDAGPCEVLGLFQNAAMVCTDSFHGVTFSIVFRKNFISWSHPSRSSRTKSLLKIMGLERRQPARCEDLNGWGKQDYQIDYRPVESRLQEQIDSSLNYLKDALAKACGRINER